MGATECGLILKTKSTVLARCPSCLGHLVGLQTGGKGLGAGRNPSHLLPPSGEPESWATGNLCAPLSLHRRVAGGFLPLVAAVCMDKKGLCNICTRTSSLSSVLPLQNYLNGNQSIFDSKGVHFICHFKKTQILQSIHKNALHQREDRGTTERSQSRECFAFSVVDLTYKTGPKAFSGIARTGKS